MVTARVEPERYERTARRWVSKLVLEATDVALADVAAVAVALEALPREPGARATIAEIYRGVGLDDVAAVFSV